MSEAYHFEPFFSSFLPDYITKKDVEENPFLLFELINFNAWKKILKKAMVRWRRSQPPLKGSKRGRPSIGPMGMLKVLFLRMLTGWSDRRVSEAVTYDSRLVAFFHFKHPPKRQTIWKWREIFVRHKALEKIFNYDLWRIKQILPLAGTKVVGIDSTLVRVPVQRNSRRENQSIRAGNGKRLWPGKPHKRSQKDVDAAWSKKHDKDRYGYSAHTLFCLIYKLAMGCYVTGPNVHDVKAAETLIKLLPPYLENIGPYEALADDSPCLAGDAAYTSARLHELVRALGWRPMTVLKAPKKGKLTPWQKEYNHSISQIRSGVGHPFGMIKDSCSGLMLYCKGIKRATQNILGRLWAYNLRRLLLFGA